MSKVGDKEAVFRTTQVRTKLRGDNSWLQRRSEPQAEATEEKPWIAEVRAGRVNGAPQETSPVSSPTKPTPPPPTKTDTERAPTSGYLIRGVFTKLDKPASPTTSNGYRTPLAKKPSESYKKIAPYTLRPTSGNQDDLLSQEEQEKRTEAASSVLKKSAVKQRSYVLSAAKKYESKEETPDTSNIVSFVAKRVEITDDDESAATPAPASPPPSSSVAPVTSVTSAPQPRPRRTVNTSVKTAVDVIAYEPSAPKEQPAVPKEEEAVAPKQEEVAVAPKQEEVAVAPKEEQVAVAPKEEQVVVPKEEEVVAPKQEEVAVAPKEVAPKEEEVVVPKEKEVVAPKQEEVAVAPKEEEVVVVPKQEEVVAPKQQEVAPKQEEVAVAPKEEEVVVPKQEEVVAPKQEEVAPKEEEVVAPKQEEVVAPKQEEVAVAPKQEELVAPKEEEVVVPEPVKEDPAPVSVKEKDPFEDMMPGCTKVATPLPVLLPEYVQAVYTDPEPEDSPLVELAPALPTPMSPSQASPVPTSPTPVSLTPLSPTPVSPAPLSPAPVSAVTEITVKTELKPELSPSSGVDTLAALSDTLISFDTSSSSLKDDEPGLAEEEGGSADTRTTENGVEQEPAPEYNDCVPMTDDLLALSDGPEAPAEPVPPSPGRWSQDLLGGLDSESNPAKTSLDLLADDVIVINTAARSLSMQQEEEKQTDETAKETQSPTETVTITTKTVIITDKSEEDNADPWSSHVTTTVTESSSADPFDPYPIGTTSPNSSVDLLQPSSDISINRVPYTFTENKDPSPETIMSSNALESLADDVIPIDTDTKRLSTHRSWTRTWETTTPQQVDTEKSHQDTEPEYRAADGDFLVTFERKCTENDSPWDRWTSPCVYTITTEEDEEEEEEEEEEEKSPEDTQTQTVTTITTIREIHSEPEPAMDRYETYSRTVTEEDQRVQTPEPEGKKPFVYVKEYVNATELSLHNARDAFDGASDHLQSTSTTFSYTSPSIYSSGSLSSTCTYCGGLVGNDAKISIEHLNINCHPACFLCAMCSKPMGDLLDSMFLHGGKVHCESCYSKAME